MTPKIGDICISKYDEVFTIIGYNKYSNVEFNLLNFNAAERIKQIKSKVQ
jgi:hypothetical protein